MPVPQLRGHAPTHWPRLQRGKARLLGPKRATQEQAAVTGKLETYVWSVWRRHYKCGVSGTHTASQDPTPRASKSKHPVPWTTHQDTHRPNTDLPESPLAMLRQPDRQADEGTPGRGRARPEAPMLQLPKGRPGSLHLAPLPREAPSPSPHSTASSKLSPSSTSCTPVHQASGLWIRLPCWH